MWLESTVGVGSTFGFSIPGLPERGDEVASDLSVAELPVVVLVDDDRASLDLLVGLPRRFADPGGPRARTGSRRSS